MVLFKKHDASWWEAEYNGQKGYVPAEWFEELASAAMSPASSRASVSSPPPMPGAGGGPDGPVDASGAPPPPPMPSADAAPSGGAGGGMAAALAAAAKKREDRVAAGGGTGGGGGGGGRSKVRGVYEFEADGSTEFSFGVDEIFTLIDKADDVWWEVERDDGTRGFVPVDFVEEIPGSRRGSRRSSRRNSASGGGGGMSGAGGLFAGGFPTLRKTGGPDAAAPKSPESNGGGGGGGMSGAGGLFAGGFPTLRKTEGPRSPSPKKAQEDAPGPGGLFAGGFPKLRKTGVTLDGPGKPEAKPVAPPAPPPVDALAPGEVKATVLFDFTPDGPGELGLSKGDKLVVTNMADDEWWEGRNNGNQGYFPKTYVKLEAAAPGGPRPPPGPPPM